MEEGELVVLPRTREELAMVEALVYAFAATGAAGARRMLARG